MSLLGRLAATFRKRKLEQELDEDALPSGGKNATEHGDRPNSRRGAGSSRKAVRQPYTSARSSDGNRPARMDGVSEPGLETVSYTHLRAHETPEHLVCRLLLEKKK